MTAALVGFALPVRAASECDGPGPRTGTVTAVDARLELMLEDGTRLGIAGLDPALPTPDDPDLDSENRDAVAGWLVGKPIGFRPLAGRPDRWGRLPALVFAMDDPTPASAAAAILAQGLARYRPDPALSGCIAPLRDIETVAREARLGLWADPYYAVLGTTDQAGFAERAGGVVLAEGVLRDVRGGRVRTMLLFQPRDRGRNTLAVTMLQRKVANFEAAGIEFRALVGRTLRVRGLLETHFGPHIEIATPDDVEILPASAPKAATTAAAPAHEAR